MANTNPGDQHDRTNYTGSNPNETPGVQPNPQSYGSGYIHGQTVERQRYEATQQTRDENNSATGFLIGILLTGLVLGGAALAYFATQRNQTPVQRTIVVPSAAPSPSPSPAVKERVIERDRIVPVPQPQQSSPTVIPAPNIKIEAPKPVAPAPQTAPAAPSSSSQKESPAIEQPRSAEPSPSPEASPNSNSSESNNSGQ
ncbi:hypothetical protein NC981_17435 [Leptolyngbya sp. DQ-M1]|uniref:hypothetical protein n=1 Tax=Leptolyngbya sp. DQ-M1 TaxID=2933920 RepID=UPI003297219A